jgi:hypothetical protein
MLMGPEPVAAGGLAASGAKKKTAAVKSKAQAAKPARAAPKVVDDLF